MGLFKEEMRRLWRFLTNRKRYLHLADCSSAFIQYRSVCGRKGIRTGGFLEMTCPHCIKQTPNYQEYKSDTK